MLFLFNYVHVAFAAISKLKILHVPLNPTEAFRDSFSCLHKEREVSQAYKIDSEVGDCDDAIANVDVSCVNHFSRAHEV